MERTADFFNELIANPDYQDKTILIATHGCALRAMLNSLYETGIASGRNMYLTTVP